MKLPCSTERRETGLPYEKVGMFVKNFELNPPKEPNLGVARALFDP